LRTELDLTWHTSCTFSRRNQKILAAGPLTIILEAIMAFMQGIEPAEAGWFTRLVYWFVRRQFGRLTGKSRLIEPVKIAAHHPRLLKAMGQMEGGLGAARSVPSELKLLVSLKSAMLVGCPF
jgi:4-carboxymuconolactone decarboxylase